MDDNESGVLWTRVYATVFSGTRQVWTETQELHKINQPTLTVIVRLQQYLWGYNSI